MSESAKSVLASLAALGLLAIGAHFGGEALLLIAMLCGGVAIGLLIVASWRP